MDSPALNSINDHLQSEVIFVKVLQGAYKSEDILLVAADFIAQCLESRQ